MIKRLISHWLIICYLIILLAGSASASLLYKIRFGNYKDKLRCVFDFADGFNYTVDRTKEKVSLRFKQTMAGPNLDNYIEVNDFVVRYMELQRDGETLQVNIPLAEPVASTVFFRSDPPRLVVDFDREFVSVASAGTIADGIEHLKIKQGTSAGLISANLLKIDLAKAQVVPALTRKYKPNFFQSFISLLTPWVNRDSPKHFFLNKVSSIVAEHNGLAGINGTYFANSGNPLGALMVNRELVSFPIHDRTALFLDEGNQAYIDNIFVSSYFELKNGSRYKITGLNQSRSSDDIIMYTPAWSKKTGTDQQGIEIAVLRSKVAKINIANSEVPEDGYVISAAGPAVETLAESVKVGDPVSADIKIVTYSTRPKNIVQLISGGPRLLKAGRIYISKHEEQFQHDIATSRAARTAVGINQEGKLLLLTVDGRPKKIRRSSEARASLGPTLEELSKLLQSLGAVDAMNLDGGSSSTMVINGRVVNKPTSGAQRLVSNAIVVQPKGR